MRTRQTNEASPANIISLGRDAHESLADLTKSLLAWKGSNQLFEANIGGDQAPSITVSAIAMLALHETRNSVAQIICDAILQARLLDGPQAGAWRAQGGHYSHTYAASWALFAVLRVRPSYVKQAQITASWLLDQRSRPGSGWGHTKETRPRAFNTAYVMKALIEYLSASSLVGGGDISFLAKVREGVEDAKNFLLDESQNTATDEIWLWDLVPKGDGVCLATSSIALHVLAKYYRMIKPEQQRLVAPSLRRSFDALCRVITTETLRQSRTSLEINGESLAVDVWPDLNENTPSYWNRYFTPSLGLTLMDIARDISISDDRALIPAALACVEWIIRHSSRQANGNIGVLGASGSRAYIWSTAQAVSVLRCWLDALEEVVYYKPELFTLDACKVTVLGSVNTSHLAKLLSNLFAENTEIRMILTDSGIETNKVLDTAGTPEEIWFKLLKRIDEDTETLVKILEKALDRKPGDNNLRQCLEHFKGLQK